MRDEVSREEILRRVQQRGGDCVEGMYGNCAQSVLYALREDFPLVSVIPLHALTAMSGIALRGETCGAVGGALLAIGALAAPEDASFLEALPDTLSQATKFCDAFEDEFGSLVCRNIHTKVFGRHYDLLDPVQQQEFIEVGGLIKCRAPVETASRIVAEIVLDER